jgi:hypothetical protein
MSGEIVSFEQTVERFNLSAETQFSKNQIEFNPMLKDIAYKYNSGAISESFFYVNLLFSTHGDFKGTASYKKINELVKQSISNREKEVEGIEILTRDFKRAQQANSISGLSMYITAIGNLAIEAKNAPYEDSIDLLEQGETNTYGTCFDNQNLYSTTHNYGAVAGTQSNLLTGTGTTTAQISVDLKSAMNAMNSFYYQTDQNDGSAKKKRKLNGRLATPKFTVYCNSQLRAQFEDIRNGALLVTDTNVATQTNTLRNAFDIVDHPFDDVNDYYIMESSEPTVKPILISSEDEGSLIMPEDNPQALNNLRTLRYGHKDLSYGLGYGAWWKTVKIKNS